LKYNCCFSISFRTFIYLYGFYVNPHSGILHENLSYDTPLTTFDLLTLRSEKLMKPPPPTLLVFKSVFEAYGSFYLFNIHVISKLVQYTGIHHIKPDY